MAQVNATNVKKLGKVFSNEVGFVRMTYDFSLDGGATTDTYVLGETEGKILILDAAVHVETAATSGGEATVKIGVNGGDDDAFLDTTSGAVAALTDDAVVKEVAGQSIVLADGAKIEMVIGTAALTAGKINVLVQYVNIA